MNADGAAPLAECLWRVVDTWEHSKQMAFVTFVTGSNHLPVPETEYLHVELPFIAYPGNMMFDGPHLEAP